ncbi:10303_t:CDS:2 [Dentiscutata erythropus]|uniref:10303_t:CDS:1 n=1 Tax=Dentiscutata erythropus TaxID=1348616 RepID=A0A9N9HWM5_9GLOM|nr:10303_t:CDS:2 [Dentiscutata erythropus]
MAQRRRQLNVDLNYYELPTTITRIDTIREKLIRELSQQYPDLSNVTSKELSLFLGQFQKFQEDALGRLTPRFDKIPPKIPAKLFKLEPAPGLNLPIYHTIRTAYKFRAQKKWKRWDWELNRNELIEMVKQIRTHLESKGFIRKFMILLGESVAGGTHRQELIEHINNLGGQVTHDLTRATHIIHATNEHNYDADEEWYRTLEKKDGKVLLHWWYYPDSYDSWLDEGEHADPEPNPIHHGPWNVSERWLRDSAEFNEWMNEEDYEITDSKLNAEEHSGISESEASPTNKRNLDSLESPSKMEVDVRPTIGAKRPRLRSPDHDTVPEHPNMSLVDIEQEASRAGGIRAKKNEFDPVIGGEIANISQLVPAERSTNEDAQQNLEDPEAVDENVDTVNITSNMEGVRIPANNNNIDVEMTEQDQNNISSGRAEHKVSTNPAAKELDEDEHMATADDNRQIDDDTNEPLSDTVIPQEVLSANDEDEKKRLEEEARKYLSEQTQEIVIPSYSAWFNMSTVHPIEKKSLPEFFNNRNKSKNPSIYKEYRDFIINTYRLNPGEYLTVTACRRNLAGDVCAVIRLHAFLEQWGLINYQVDPDTRPSPVGPSFTGHFRITADTPRGLQPFQPLGPSTALSNSVATTSTVNTISSMANEPSITANPKVDKVFGIRQNVYQSGMNMVATPGSQDETGSVAADSGSNEQKQYHCVTCGVNCTRVRYHSVKTQNFELCTNCYLEGRYPTSMYSGDFLKMEETPFKHAQDDDWTEQENLDLLEGVELYEDDWNKISEHVGTRTREQCILHFLEFPIEDPLNETKMSDLGPLQYQRIPFSQADNPVMSVVAFLASVVNPGVAAAAAKSALKELSLHNKKSANKEINGVNGIRSGEPSETAASTPMADVKIGDEMDTEGATGLKPDPEQTPEEAATSDSVPRQKLLERAGATAMGAAAAKAKVLADYEEREIQRLVNAVIENQLKKLELKLQQFEELENALENEKKELEKQRQLLYNERLAFKKNTIIMQDQLRNVQASSSGPKPPTSGHGYLNSSNSRIISKIEYQQQQQIRQPVGPLSQEQGSDDPVLMNI